MSKIKLFLVLATAFLSCREALNARQPYHATVTLNHVSAHVSASNMTDLSNDLSADNLSSLLPPYNPSLPISIDFNLRGLIPSASFAANSTVLVVQMPQLGKTLTFNGGSREVSVALFRQYVQDFGQKDELLKLYARYSPIDPIAGNPNSLQTMMGKSDYLLGQLSPLAGCECSWCAQPIVHQFQAGSYAGRAFSRGFDTTTITLPLRYSYSPDLSWAFIIDAPLTYNRNGGASSIFTSLGFGFRYPVTCAWSLTPVLRLGSGGSVDLCTAGSFVSAGVTSQFNYNILECVLGITNYAGYVSSTNLWLSGHNANYHLHNYEFVNGFQLTTCRGIDFCKRKVHFALSFMDSYIAREHLFIRHFDEIDVSLIITRFNPCLDYDCLILGTSYQFGEKGYKAVFLNLAYQF